jgi:hypothetical protein
MDIETIRREWNAERERWAHIVTLLMAENARLKTESK